MLKSKRTYNSLGIAAIALTIISFFYKGEGLAWPVNTESSYISFAVIWRFCALFLAGLWFVYRIFDERLHSDMLIRIHVLGSLFTTLLIISYPMWMNNVRVWTAIYLTVTISALIQVVFLINISKGLRHSKSDVTNSGF